MAKIGKSNKKHYATPQEKATQRRRTRANKIKRLTKMVLENPNDKKAEERLKYWEDQKT